MLICMLPLLPILISHGLSVVCLVLILQYVLFVHYIVQPNSHCKKITPVNGIGLDVHAFLQIKECAITLHFNGLWLGTSGATK